MAMYSTSPRDFPWSFNQPWATTLRRFSNHGKSECECFTIYIKDITANSNLERLYIIFKALSCTPCDNLYNQPQTSNMHNSFHKHNQSKNREEKGTIKSTEHPINNVPGQSWRVTLPGSVITRCESHKNPRTDMVLTQNMFLRYALHCHFSYPYVMKKGKTYNTNFEFAWTE